jgi:hypothetical protein
MSHEAAVRHASVALAIPALQHPLRRDPKPRPVWPAHLIHLQPTVRDGLAWSVDRFVDERRPADAGQWPLGQRA